MVIREQSPQTTLLLRQRITSSTTRSSINCHPMQARSCPVVGDKGGKNTVRMAVGFRTERRDGHCTAYPRGNRNLDCMSAQVWRRVCAKKFIKAQYLDGTDLGWLHFSLGKVEVGVLLERRTHPPGGHALSSFISHKRGTTQRPHLGRPSPPSIGRAVP